MYKQIYILVYFVACLGESPDTILFLLLLVLDAIGLSTLGLSLLGLSTLGLSTLGLWSQFRVLIYSPLSHLFLSVVT